VKRSCVTIVVLYFFLTEFSLNLAALQLRIFLTSSITFVWMSQCFNTVVYLGIGGFGEAETKYQVSEVSLWAADEDRETSCISERSQVSVINRTQGYSC